ncbi:hypothetical protein IV203_024258 [Nitzschia inconspicua]|uniref:Uncharacterized protein n=1 Tax=Nitzschia inconspicua TaxID=303405 RepID=A0A9K3KBN6_9STRA|nr:hypothetical protein IV203_024258 [Nitzschia inconspicua]
MKSPASSLFTGKRCRSNLSITRAAWKWTFILVAMFIVIGYRLDWKAVESLDDMEGGDLHRISYRCNVTVEKLDSIYFASTDPTTITTGELPGYTGWARPEKTLAGYFGIQSVSSNTPTVGQAFTIAVLCEGHDDCQKDSARFFLRAYGPAVIPGTVVKGKIRHPGTYDIQFRFLDPGQYTVEVVLTFSTSPSIETFPLDGESQQPAYEGYLLPGFPLLITVHPKEEVATQGSHDLCQIDDLIVKHTTEAIHTARWKVTSRSNAAGYTGTTVNNPVSKQGYIENYNSIGINMEYQYMSGCNLLPISAFEGRLQGHRVFGRAQCQTISDDKKLHIIYIGDSVMRVQKDKLRALAGQTPNLELHFLPLHLGYRRNEILGPSNVRAYLKDIQQNYSNDTKVVLFNTGLHDIHQLCGAENTNDRKTYLNTTHVDSGKFSCTAEYKLILYDFLRTIHDFPADLKVFQTTTAAWPKYGNWGIGWEHNPQGMPLVSDFCETFNDIAFKVLKEWNSKNEQDKILIMDGYWVTYTRPDNREYGAIGNKLSHPGDEVLSTMARIWATLIVDKHC